MSNEHKNKRWVFRIAAAAAVVALFSPVFTARGLAEERGREREFLHERDDHWRGDIRHFGEADMHRWRGGHWTHGWHGGRLGWWWIVGGLWYFYPAPVYPYPDPYVPPVVATPAPPVAQAPTQYWYYCKSAGMYYPYATSCPEGWMQVVPQPQ